MELTRRETQIMVLAISTAIEKELNAIEGLKHEIQIQGVTSAIVERRNLVDELGRLRARLRNG